MVLSTMTGKVLMVLMMSMEFLLDLKRPQELTLQRLPLAFGQA